MSACASFVFVLHCTFGIPNSSTSRSNDELLTKFAGELDEPSSLSLSLSLALTVGVDVTSALLVGGVKISSKDSGKTSSKMHDCGNLSGNKDLQLSPFCSSNGELGVAILA